MISFQAAISFNRHQLHVYDVYQQQIDLSADQNIRRKKKSKNKNQMEGNLKFRRIMTGYFLKYKITYIDV